jgi:hypothetical protein
VHYRVDLLNLTEDLKLKQQTLLGEELTKQLHLKGNTAIS